MKTIEFLFLKIDLSIITSKNIIRDLFRNVFNDFYILFDKKTYVFKHT